MAFIKFKPIASRLNFYSILCEEDAKREITPLLETKEDIIAAFKSVRDVGIFTDKRIILIDKKGIRGFRRSIYSIKYSSISSYALNIHSVDSSIELIFDSGHKLLMNFIKPIPLENMFNLYKYISDFVLTKTK